MLSRVHMTMSLVTSLSVRVGVALTLSVGLMTQTLNAEVITNQRIAESERQEVLIIGRVSTSPREHYAAFDGLGRYLVNRLRDVGIKRHAVALPQSNDEMIALVRQGKIDLLSESPFSALWFEQSAGAEILLREWKGGVPSYRTIFVARRDSPLESLHDLAGRKIAFEDPGSTSAYFVPMLTLRSEGLSVIPLENITPATDPEAVGYIFAGTELNILYAVTGGTVDAGAMSNLDWVTPRNAPEGLKRQLRIFYETPDILRSLLLARPNLPPELKMRVKQVLTAMHQSEEGRRALQAYFRLARFDHVTGEAAADLTHVRELFAEARQHFREAALK